MPTDNFKNFGQAVRKEVKENYNKTKVNYPNQLDFEKPNNSAWVKMSLNEGDAQAIDIAQSPTFRHPGTLAFGIFIPLQQGTSEAEEIADDLASIFRYKQLDTTQFLAPSLETIGRVDIDDGAWWQEDLVIPFERDAQFKV